MLDLYEAILTRRSVRRYAGRDVPAGLLKQLADFAQEIEPLVQSADFSYSIRPAKNNELTSAAGGYGRILSATLVIVPHIADGPNALVDFGFRTEQLVIHATRLGLGSCWVGALRHEASAAEEFSVPPGSRIGAVIALGYPETGIVGRAANRLIRSAAGAGSRPPLERLVLGQGAPTSKQQRKVLEALRAAPSTGNARPWRVVLREGLLYLAVKEDAGYYRLSGNVGYHLVDAGIGMANLSLALKALDRPAPWTLLDKSDELALPDNLRLIGSVPLPD